MVYSLLINFSIFRSYFTFRLASLHHQFFLRLRTEYTSLQSLSQQFGIPLKDMKNETNSLYKLEALTNPYVEPDNGTVNAETEFQIAFRASTRSSRKQFQVGLTKTFFFILLRFDLRNFSKRNIYLTFYVFEKRQSF